MCRRSLSLTVVCERPDCQGHVHVVGTPTRCRLPSDCVCGCVCVQNSALCVCREWSCFLLLSRSLSLSLSRSRSLRGFCLSCARQPTRALACKPANNNLHDTDSQKLLQLLVLQVPHLSPPPCYHAALLPQRMHLVRIKGRSHEPRGKAHACRSTPPAVHQPSM